METDACSLALDAEGVVAAVKVTVDARAHAAFPQYVDDAGRGASFDPRREVEHRHARAQATEAPIRVRNRQSQSRKLTDEDRRVAGNGHRIVGCGPSARADEDHPTKIESVVLQRMAPRRKRLPHLGDRRPPPVVITAEEELHTATRADPGEIGAGLV